MATQQVAQAVAQEGNRVRVRIWREMEQRYVTITGTVSSVWGKPATDPYVSIVQDNTGSHYVRFRSECTVVAQ